MPSKIPEVAVFAGSHVQAREWARSERLGPHEWFYLADPDVNLRGTTRLVLARVGSFLSDRKPSELESLSWWVAEMKGHGTYTAYDPALHGRAARDR